MRDHDLLDRFATHVAGCRLDYADSLDDERRQTFEPIKIEGIKESGLGIVATYDPTRSGPNVLGRHTINDAGIFSVVCAVQNLWLMATARGIGVGWVSFYQEPFLKELLGIPEHVRPVGWLCVAPENSSSFSVSVVLPASGWEMMAKVRRRQVSLA